MQFITLLSTAAALIAGSSALVIPRATYLGNFRSFGTQGCYYINLGVWTLIDDDFKNNECHTGFNGDTVKAVSLTNMVNGCTMRVYPDDNCGYGGTDVLVEQCTNAEDEWRSFSVHCVSENQGPSY